MFALFTAVPLVGHVNPLLRQADALRARGWRVAFAGADEIRAHVEAEAPAVPFVSLGSIGPLAGSLRDAQAAASRDRSFARSAYRMVAALWPLWLPMFDGVTRAIAADRPDVVVVDLFSSAGLAAAHASRLPCVVNNPDLLGALSMKFLPPADHLPLLFSGRGRDDVRWHHRALAPLQRRFSGLAATAVVGRQLNALRKQRQLQPIDIHQMLRGCTVLVDGAFGLEYPRPLPRNVEMVGPMLPARVPPLPTDVAEWLDADTSPVVYVSFGTLATLSASQTARIADALSTAECRAFWALPRGHAEDRPVSTDRVRVVPWGPSPMAMLSHPRVRAFVSHCGINSAHESLWAGTPIVGIPMFADQQDMAIRVRDAGAGVWLDKDRFTAGELRDAIHRVMSDERFHAAIPALQRAMVEAGGVERAADLIEARARNM